MKELFQVFLKLKEVNETGYWRPNVGEIVILEEEPHIVKLVFSDEKSMRRITVIPHAYRDSLMAGTELTVESIYGAQDMHYE